LAVPLALLEGGWAPSSTEEKSAGGWVVGAPAVGLGFCSLMTAEKEIMAERYDLSNRVPRETGVFDVRG